MTHAEKAALLAALRPRLLRRARRYAASHAEAEDLAQEALLRVWSRLAAEAPVDDLERYLFTTLRNLARRRRPPESALTEADTPVTPPAAGARLAAAEVMAALAHLPPAQASLLVDRAISGASYAELARRHGLPVGTVMSRVARARARLRAEVGLAPGSGVEALIDRGA